MPDDKGGMKDKLRDEFDKATGKKKKKDDKDKDSEGVKENLRDEFDEATGKDEKDSDS